MTYRDFEVFGGVREFVNYRGSETIVHGPAETGKTLGVLFKLHIAAMTYPKASIVIARKTLASTYSTVLVTFMEKVLGENKSQWPCTPYGGMRPEWFDYPNGSRIWLAGMDKPGKVLSAEHDIFYFNQVEEDQLQDWETATTRTTGRAGHMPYSQTIGDANPAWPLHWMYNRPSLRMFYSRHEENPSLFDQETGEITEQGKITISVLDNLTGVRKERLRYGRAVQAEGAIYTEWDESTHYIYDDKLPRFFRYVAGLDWGYQNAGVLGLFAIEGKSGAAYLIEQYYHTKKLDDWWLEKALDMHVRFGVEVFVCDPSEPAYIAKFKNAGLNAIGGFNAVLPGINAFKARLQNGLYYVVRDSLGLVDEELKTNHRPFKVEDEFASYVWADKKVKDQPVKADDHGMDMSRYVVCYLDKIGQEKKKAAGVW